MLLIVQLEEAAAWKLPWQAGRTTRAGGNADCSEPHSLACLQLMAPSWGSHRPGVAPLSPTFPASRETVLETFLPVLSPKLLILLSWMTVQMQTKMLLKTVP